MLLKSSNREHNYLLDSICEWNVLPQGNFHIEMMNEFTSKLIFSGKQIMIFIIYIMTFLFAIKKPPAYIMYNLGKTSLYFIMKEIPHAVSSILLVEN